MYYAFIYSLDVFLFTTHCFLTSQLLFFLAIFLIVDYARDRILRVYAHGSPPIATVVNKSIVKSEGENIECPILEAFGLPVSMVYGYIQPYDPVVRLFSGHDVLYP